MCKYFLLVVWQEGGNTRLLLTIYIFFIFTAPILVQLCWCQPPPASCIAGRDYLPFGASRRTPGERGPREGSQAVPRRPPPMEGFPPYQ